jgi:hypothetical protein
MKKTLRLRNLALAVLLAPLLMGNAPAPWYACDGKQVGDPCGGSSSSGCGGYGGGSADGVCAQSSAACVDLPNTSVNECLFCKR